MAKKITHLMERSYSQLFTGVADLLEQARKYSARSVNAIMASTYWEVGRRIVEHEQQGKKRAKYGEALIERLALDLTAKFGRGFSKKQPLANERFLSRMANSPDGVWRATSCQNPYQGTR